LETAHSLSVRSVFRQGALLRLSKGARIMLLGSAYDILNRSIIEFEGEPVGTSAAVDPDPAAVHYHECFIRDFVPSALVFLLDGRTDIVRNFLRAVMKLRGMQPVPEGHKRSKGLMPASFRVGN
jgi:hypothetical protein